MAVKLESRLGNVALSIEASLRNGKAEAAAALAMQQLVFHQAGSKAFGKKGSHPDRAEAFNETLAADVEAACAQALVGLFEGIKITTKSYVPAAKDAEKLIADLEKLGASAETLAALRSEVKSPTAAKTAASDEESVG